MAFMISCIFSLASESSFFSRYSGKAAASMEMMDNRYTYMRHPILLRFYSFVGLNYVKHGNKHPNRGGWILSLIHI